MFIEQHRDLKFCFNYFKTVTVQINHGNFFISSRRYPVSCNRTLKSNFSKLEIENISLVSKCLYNLSYEKTSGHGATRNQYIQQKIIALQIEWITCKIKDSQRA